MLDGVIFIIQLGVTVTVVQSKEDFIDTYAGAQPTARLLLYALCSTDAVIRGLIRNCSMAVYDACDDVLYSVRVHPRWWLWRPPLTLEFERVTVELPGHDSDRRHLAHGLVVSNFQSVSSVASLFMGAWPSSACCR